MSTSALTWLNCSACKNPIRFLQNHWVCSVSTCNRARTRLVFCTVSCWDSHVAMLRHRDAWAVDARAPGQAEWQAELETTASASSSVEVVAAPRRVIGATPSTGVSTSASVSGSTGGPAFAEAERDVLIVVSKLKKYVRERSGMNCSDAIAEGLSDHVRAICDEAIRTAAADNRKTVLERDVPKLRR